MDLSIIFWLIFIFSFLSPAIQQRLTNIRRLRAIRQLEQERGTRVITLIHRQESIAFLGIPLTRYIDIDDSEAILRAIRLTPPDLPIDLIVHTPGGLVLAAEQIAHALIHHKGKVTVFVPHYAMSGGTLVALAADEIGMDVNAVLGPVDPQLGQYPAVSILTVIDKKPLAEIDDETLIMADIAQKAIRQVRATVEEILTANGMAPDKARELADTLSCGRWTHDYPIGFEEATRLGLPVTTNV
ncbi:MAG: ATP-dependent Clp protease proteolytic subunit, partial [Thermomicrobiaceae bacterium]|nr:ATP-dependent Clp protease proteolytic subunit [Thermomicrobiaceae bacterium]